MDLQDQPHGIILQGHGRSKGKLIIIPKEEFTPFWSSAFSCREEPDNSWANQAIIGEPSDLALKPPAGDLPCIMVKDGIYQKEELSLVKALRKNNWKWTTKILIQNGCKMKEDATNNNYKHVDCSCDHSRRGGLRPAGFSMYSRK